MWSASPRPQEEPCRLQFSYVVTTHREKQKTNICCRTWWPSQAKTFAGAQGFWTREKATATTKWINCGESSPGEFLAVTRWRAHNQWFPLWSQSWQGQGSNLGLGCKQLQWYVRSIRLEIGKHILHHNKSTSAVAWKKTQRQTTVFWWCSVEARGGKKRCFEHICLHETLESLKDKIEFLKTRCTRCTDLPDQLQANIDRGASTAQADPHDTICLVKRYMGSESLSQRPLLIMTASRGDRVGLVPSTKLQSRKVSFQISFGFLRQTLGSEIFWV